MWHFWYCEAWLAFLIHKQSSGWRNLQQSSCDSLWWSSSRRCNGSHRSGLAAWASWPLCFGKCFTWKVNVGLASWLHQDGELIVAFCVNSSFRPSMPCSLTSPIMLCCIQNLKRRCVNPQLRSINWRYLRLISSFSFHCGGLLLRVWPHCSYKHTTYS